MKADIFLTENIFEVIQKNHIFWKDWFRIISNVRSDKLSRSLKTWTGRYRALKRSFSNHFECEKFVRAACKPIDANILLTENMLQIILENLLVCKRKFPIISTFWEVCLSTLRTCIRKHSHYTKYAFDHPEKQRCRKRSLSNHSQYACYPFCLSTENLYTQTLFLHKTCLRWSWKSTLSKKINLESRRMCVCWALVSELLENLYRQTIFSHKICLRWSWKTTLSKQMNFE